MQAPGLRPVEPLLRPSKQTCKARLLLEGVPYVLRDNNRCGPAGEPAFLAFSLPETGTATNALIFPLTGSNALPVISP